MIRNLNPAFKIEKGDINFLNVVSLLFLHFTTISPSLPLIHSVPVSKSNKQPVNTIESKACFTACDEGFLSHRTWILRLINLIFTVSTFLRWGAVV